MFVRTTRWDACEKNQIPDPWEFRDHQFIFKFMQEFVEFEKKFWNLGHSRFFFDHIVSDGLIIIIYS